MKKICILGAGSWGTAQAILLHKNNKQVYLWGRIEDGINDIRLSRENKRFLPGIKIPEDINVTDKLEESLSQADLVVLAVPSQAVRQVAERITSFLSPKAYLVNTAKGLEIATGLRMSQVIEDIWGTSIKKRYAVLSGPSHAEEVAREVPTVVTIAGFCQETANIVQDTYMSSSFRVYTNPDVAGVELGGALKNIIALATGIAHGLGYGDNTKAALITRGLTEIIRMGVALGGDPRTFSGLSGIGDLIVTCSSEYSRNRRAGVLLGQGFSLEETLDKIGMVVEGAHATRVFYWLANENGIDMPITRACYNILFNRRSAQDEVQKLMTRRKKHEIEDIAENLGSW